MYNERGELVFLGVLANGAVCVGTKVVVIGISALLEVIQEKNVK